MKYSEKNLLTIITITFKNDKELLNTINSIYSQEKQPAKVLIKDGFDRQMPKFIKKNNIYISGKDYGIYDAMNIAIKYVKTPYVLFLNSGDILKNKKSLNHFYKELYNYLKKNKFLPDAIFFKWMHKNKKKLFSPSLNPLRFNHQAVIYKKSLHHEIGCYISQNKFTAADYFFFKLFLTTKKRNILLSNFVMSEIDPYGISSNLKTFLLVTIIDFLFGESSRIWLIFVAIFHPFYNFTKRILYRF